VEIRTDIDDVIQKAGRVVELRFQAGVKKQDQEDGRPEGHRRSSPVNGELPLCRLLAGQAF
jgi:hypothetical protein